ncbi:MAG: hypothetical protein KDB27_13810 [Planctomycetales bacterium]|nr:hypothetical protein [Planctomycetales bacterium]
MPGVSRESSRLLLKEIVLGQTMCVDLSVAIEIVAEVSLARFWLRFTLVTISEEISDLMLL